MARNLLKPHTRPVTMPGAFPPIPAVARILSRHDRSNLAAFVTVAIDLLDVLDGDPDLEDATDLEDDFSIYTLDLPSGAGCPIADTGEDDDPAGGSIDDEPHDPEGDLDTNERIPGGGSGM